jgi:hypothetical protein
MFRLVSLVKPASSVKSTRLLNKKSLPHCRINDRKNPCRGRASGSLRTLPFQMVRVQQLFMENPPHVSGECWYGDSPLRVSVALLQSSCSCASPSRAVCCRRPTVPVSLMRRSMALNVRGFGTLRWRHLPLRILQTFPCCTVTTDYHGLRREWSTYRRIIGMSSCPF